MYLAILEFAAAGSCRSDDGGSEWPGKREDGSLACGRMSQQQRKDREREQDSRQSRAGRCAQEFSIDDDSDDYMHDAFTRFANGRTEQVVRQEVEVLMAEAVTRWLCVDEDHMLPP